MDSPLTWAALIGAGGSICAVITFWFQRGKAEGETRAIVDAALARAEVAVRLAEKAIADTLMVNGRHADFRVEIATTYATAKGLAEAEMRHARAIEGITARFDRIDERLDRVMENTSK